MNRTHPALLELQDALEVNAHVGERLNRAWADALAAFPDDADLAARTGREEWRIRFLRGLHDRPVLFEEEVLETPHHARPRPGAE